MCVPVAADLQIRYNQQCPLRRICNPTLLNIRICNPQNYSRIACFWVASLKIFQK